MTDNLKALLAKAWKDEPLDLLPGRHYFDETITVRITGTVEKQGDQLVAPTSTLPLIPILALFWEKAGIARDHALRMLKDAITEAMAEKANPAVKSQSQPFGMRRELRWGFDSRGVFSDGH